MTKRSTHYPLKESVAVPRACRADDRICKGSLKGPMKEGMQKVASKPGIPKDIRVGFHDLSPLTDRTLMEVAETFGAIQTVNKGGTALMTPFAD